MEIVAISDTHGRHERIQVPDGDVLIHAGDLSNLGTNDELESAFNWFLDLPHQHKIVIPGNHDIDIENRPGYYAHICRQRGAYLLINDGVMIDDTLFYGSPYTPAFGHSWAFMYDRHTVELGAIWDKIPDDTKVLITHGPPKGCLDTTLEGDEAGCELLAMRVKDLSALQYHIFGHIHEGGGGVVIEEETERKAIFANASCVNRNLDVVPNAFMGVVRV